MDIPNRCESTESSSSSSPRTGVDANEFRDDGGGVGRFDSGLYVREKYSKSKSSSSKSRGEPTSTLRGAIVDVMHDNYSSQAQSLPKTTVMNAMSSAGMKLKKVKLMSLGKGTACVSFLKEARPSGKRDSPPNPHFSEGCQAICGYVGWKATRPHRIRACAWVD